jgi:hypothetical protein
VTPADIEARNLASEDYITAADGYNAAHDRGAHEGGWEAPPQLLELLTFCFLTFCATASP